MEETSALRLRISVGGIWIRCAIGLPEVDAGESFVTVEVDDLPGKKIIGNGPLEAVANGLTFVNGYISAKYPGQAMDVRLSAHQS